jgi:hypothetical protein
MGDTIAEVEDALTSLQGAMPAIAGVVGALVPGAAPAMTMAVPILSILNECAAAVETYKSGGSSHEAALAMVGHAMLSIGQQFVGAVPAAVAKAAEPVGTALKA